MNFTEKLAKHKTCPSYKDGGCCRACYMGPCKITDKVREGICGATGSTISARNLGRMAAAGASSLSTAVLSALGSQQARDWFSSQEEKGLDISKILPAERVALLNRLHLTPRNVQREIVELLHRVSIGVDQEYEHILFQTIRMSLGGVLSSTLLSAEEKQGKVEVDTAILSTEKPNILLWGNVQLISDKVNVVRVDSQIKLEVLLTSGLVDVILYDSLPPSIGYIAACYHTVCILFSSGMNVVAKAIENQAKRTQTMKFKGIISQPTLSPEILRKSVFNSNRRGTVWLAGCPDPRLEDKRMDMVNEFVANDIFVIVTGCSVNSLIDTGLLYQPVYPTGEFLKAFCEKTGIPPVVYLGGCLKEGFALRLFNGIARGAGKDISQLPICLSLPSWRSERNISLMLGAIACGISVQVGSHLPVVPEIKGFLESSCNELLLANFLKQDVSIIDHINRKREKLSLPSQLNLFVPEASGEDCMDKIAGAVFSIYNELGYGLPTNVYRNALVVELKQLGLNTSNIKVPISYQGEAISSIEELLVEDEVIVCIGDVRKGLKTALVETKKEKGMYIVFEREMVRIGCVG